MYAKSKEPKFLKLKKFLAENPCVKPRTFARWKQRGLIDFIQPGGPNTAIFVREDALDRMQLRTIVDNESVDRRCEHPHQKQRAREVRKPNWTQRLKK